MGGGGRVHIPNRACECKTSKILDHKEMLKTTGVSKWVVILLGRQIPIDRAIIQRDPIGTCIAWNKRVSINGVPK